jgi:NADH-quinone oxidoreductase subunit G
MKFQSEVGGPLRGGDPGRRLIEPKKEARPSLGPTPEPFRRREGEYLLISIYQIFGSEELSARSTHIGERTPSDFVAMSELDAKQLAVEAGDKVEVRMGNFVFRGLVNLSLGLPEGCAGIFLGSRRDLVIRESPYGVIRRIEEETWAA